MQFDRKSYKGHTQACMSGCRRTGWGKKAFARSSLERGLRYMVEHEPNINQHCHAAVKKGKCHIGMYKQEYSLHDL